MTNTLIDLLPAVAFFTAYSFFGIFVATAVLIATCWMVVAIQAARRRALPTLPLITAIAASLFGGLTLALHDAEFIKLKLTLLYGAFAFILLGSHVIGRKVLLERIPQTTIQLPTPVWRRVNFAWALFFLSCAALNFYVAHHFSEATWVKFKAFGVSLLTFAFLLGHLPFVGRYLVDGTEQQSPR